jgi:hypothetical protein
MSQHLGFQQNSNMLRTHLEKRGIDPSKCTFRIVAHGPILGEARNLEAHRQRRDVIAAMEKQLADDLDFAGYDVMNKVHSRSQLDRRMYFGIRSAVAVEFPRLTRTA